MDQKTLAAYDMRATAFADDWHDQPVPDDMHRTVLEHFLTGRTADIGCGSGRDVAWLATRGFDVIGYDPSEGLLAEARRRYPLLQFASAALPELANISDGSFANVLCETVIMHLPRADLGLALQSLLRILAPGGTLYLSWRVTAGSGERDKHGRLYTAIDADQVMQHLRSAELLFNEQSSSASSGKTTYRLVLRK
ncbi:class I SAM-dependent methyltransferase [Paraherbaspirillum soli]|uniref:Class I SAM-dependent methyltransferase n=1 Tax=Paraherbaspirillum soli TaxID=631222 RepID=A0ABW0M9D2_9BURK